MEVAHGPLGGVSGHRDARTPRSRTGGERTTSGAQVPLSSRGAGGGAVSADAVSFETASVEVEAASVELDTERPASSPMTVCASASTNGAVSMRPPHPDQTRAKPIEIQGWLLRTDPSMSVDPNGCAV
jgi:hypothetical protein